MLYYFKNFSKNILSYADLRDEISQIRQKVQLNLFGLSCQELNTEMFTRTENLRLGLIKFQVRIFFDFLCAIFSQIEGDYGPLS